MAGGAGYGLVSTLERKPGRAVIERLDPAPGGFAMAIVAFFTKTPFMWINRLVTIDTTAGRLAEFDRWRVAAGARHRSVGIPKREIRKGMVERLAVQLDNVGVSSLVIGMAMIAFAFCGIRLAPMKSLASRTIGGHFLVTCKAEPRLGSSREGLMATAALLLELGMSFNDWPRHNELLE
jgi:hypothetical protein